MSPPVGASRQEQVVGVLFLVPQRTWLPQELERWVESPDVHTVVALPVAPAVESRCPNGDSRERSTRWPPVLTRRGSSRGCSTRSDRSASSSCRRTHSEGSQ